MVKLRLRKNQLLGYFYNKMLKLWKIEHWKIWDTYWDFFERDAIWKICIKIDQTADAFEVVKDSLNILCSSNVYENPIFKPLSVNTIAIRSCLVMSMFSRS